MTVPPALPVLPDSVAESLAEPPAGMEAAEREVDIAGAALSTVSFSSEQLLVAGRFLLSPL